jgi:hypothetical protein
VLTTTALVCLLLGHPSTGSSTLPAPRKVSAFQPVARPYDVKHYRLELALERDGTFRGKARVTLAPARDLASLELDSFGLQIAAVALEDGPKLTFTQQDFDQARTGLLSVIFQRPLAAGKDATLVIDYAGRAATSHEGLFAVRDGERVAFFTQFEPTYARRVFPSNDQPDDKATTEVVVDVPGDMRALSNGVLVEEALTEEGGRPRRRAHWKQEIPHSTYLVALAVGPFVTVPVASDVPAAIHVFAGKEPNAQWAREATAAALRFQADFLGVPYPWAKYDQVAVPRFTWGGMENTSLVLNRESAMLLEDPASLVPRARASGLISHELAHQWFGNLVTCRWWNDIWLNEGFATYLELRTEESLHGSNQAELDLVAYALTGYFREEDGPRAHPLQARTAVGPEEVFDATSYTKGAMVLRMVEGWLGRDQFRRGLKAYLEAYARRNATSDEFFAVVGRATGRAAELKKLQDAWVFKKGYPVLQVSRTWNGKAAVLSVSQRPNHRDEKGPFAFKLKVVAHRRAEPAYDREVELVVDRAQVRATVPLPAEPEWVNWNQGMVALARLEPGAVPEAELRRAVREDPDPLWRMAAAHALLGDMVDPLARTPAVPSEAALAAVADLIRGDPSPYVREQVLSFFDSTRLQRLPAVLGPAIHEAATAPRGIDADPMGVARVRKAALEALGRVEHPEGWAFLRSGVVDTGAGLDLLGAYAVGVARIGDQASVHVLREALARQGPRGYPYFKAVGQAFGAVENVGGAGAIRELFGQAPGNAELAREVIRALHNNQALKGSPEGARLVRDFLVEDRAFGDEVKAKMLRVLDEVKTAEARTALTEISQLAGSARLKASADQVLRKNFGGPADGKAKAPPSR